MELQYIVIMLYFYKFFPYKDDEYIKLLMMIMTRVDVLQKKMFQVSLQLVILYLQQFFFFVS